MGAGIAQMRGFLLLATEEEMRTFIENKYYGLRFQISNEPSDRIDRAANIYLEKEWKDICKLPFAEDPLFKTCLKKDMLCLALLTCDYWRSRKKKHDLTGEIDYNEQKIKNIDWKVDFEFEIENRIKLKTTEFMLGIKKYIIENSNIWNKKGKGKNRFRLDYICGSFYDRLAPEEQYMWQYMTGFPVVYALTESNLDGGREKVLFNWISQVNGVFLRDFYIHKYLEIKSEAEKQQLPIDTYIHDQFEVVMSPWERFDKMECTKDNLKALFINYLTDRGDASELGKTGQTIGDCLFQIYRGFLKVLYLTISGDDNVSQWFATLYQVFESEYSLQGSQRDDFWILDDYKDICKKIEGRCSGDSRNSDNKRMMNMQEMILEYILKYNSSLSNELARLPVSFLPRHDSTQIVPAIR